MNRNFGLGLGARMKKTDGTILSGAVGMLVLSAACAGTRLNDVGDINGAAEGDAGSGGGSLTMQSAGDGGGGVAGSSSVVQGGDGGTSLVAVGGGGGDGNVQFSCPDCTVLAETSDIRAVWASNERVYWIEYGGFDPLGNYQDDGRLLAVPVTGGESEVISSGLQGPTQLGVSENFAYVIEERSSAAQGPLELSRISLDTGEPERLQPLPEGLDHPYDGVTQNWFRRYFAVAGESAYWLNDGAIYRMPEAGTTAPEALLETESSLLTLLADESKLFLHDAAGVTTLPLAGGVPSPLWTSSAAAALDCLSLADGYLYGSEAGPTSYLGRLPKVGGSYQRIVPAFSPWISRLRVDGSRYIADAAPWNDSGEGVAETNLSEGSLDDSTSQHVVAVSPLWGVELGRRQFIWRAWDATNTTIYLGYEDRLYQVTRR